MDIIAKIASYVLDNSIHFTDYRNYYSGAITPYLHIWNKRYSFRSRDSKHFYDGQLLGVTLNPPLRNSTHVAQSCVVTFYFSVPFTLLTAISARTSMNYNYGPAASTQGNIELYIRTRRSLCVFNRYEWMHLRTVLIDNSRDSNRANTAEFHRKILK